MIANALPRPLTAGSVDNAILRADGTGGATLQNSGLIVEDTIISFTTVTGTASDDIITATGSTFSNGQPVRFTALTGGTGLNTTTNYFVRAASGATFKLATTDSDATIVNFSTNITAGTLLTGHSVQVNVTLSENTTETNSALVLSPKGTGALIAGPRPDGTTTGGNARGARAVDLQMSRSGAAQVASGLQAFVGGGSRNTASASGTLVCGGYGNSATASYVDSYPSAVCGGENNTASNHSTFVGGGRGNLASGTRASVCAGESNSSTQNSAFVGGGLGNLASGIGSVVAGGGASDLIGGSTASGSYSSILGGIKGEASRYGMQAHAAGQFANHGDAQRARFVLRNKTTTNAAVELFLDGSATRLTIPSGKVLALTINISGISSTGAAVAHYLRQYCLKNVAGTTSQVYAPVTIGTDNAAGTTIALSANDTNDALKVEVTGITSEIWRWVASVDAVEIAFGI
jgi:hypothetical protein